MVYRYVSPPPIPYTFQGRPRPEVRSWGSRATSTLAISLVVTVSASAGLTGSGPIAALEGRSKPAAEDWHAQQTPNLTRPTAFCE